MATIELRSSAFNDHAPIPARYSKDDEDVPPGLAWSGVPEGTAELAVLCEDPDAPGGAFVHWVLSGQPFADRPGRRRGAVRRGRGRQRLRRHRLRRATATVGDPAHRYFFTIHASSEPLGLSPGATADDPRQALERRQLARGTLVGLYER